MADIDVAIHERVPDGQWEIVDVTFPTANTDIQIPHKLSPPGPEYIEYTVLRQTGPGDIYEDRSATRTTWQPNFIVLRCTQAGLTARLLLRVLKAPSVYTPGVVVLGTYTFPGNVHITGLLTGSGQGKNIISSSFPSGENSLRIVNTYNGTDNYASMRVGTNASEGLLSMYAFPTNWVTNGSYVADGAAIEGRASGGLSLSAMDYYASIRFYTGSYNNERMRIAADGKVGINTNDPKFPLDVTTSTPNTEAWPYRATIRAYGTSTNLVRFACHANTSDEQPYFVCLRSRASDAALQQSDGIGGLLWLGKADGTNWSAAAQIYAYATENWGSGARGGEIVISTTKTGSTASGERLRINGSGYIGINQPAPTVLLDLLSNIDGSSAVWPDRVVGRVKSTGTNLARWSVWCESDTQIPDYNLMRSMASNAAVPSTTSIGAMSFMGKYGSTATDWYTGAQILATTGANNWSSTEAGTNLFFKTVAQGSSTINTRLVINHKGQVTIGSGDQGVQFASWNAFTDADAESHFISYSSSRAHYVALRGHSAWHGIIARSYDDTTSYWYLGNQGGTSGELNYYCRSGGSWYQRTRSHLYGFDILGAFRCEPKSGSVGSGSYNNLQLTYHTERTFYEITPSGNMTITGLDLNNQEGRVIFLINSSGSYTVTLTHEDSNSTASMRFNNPGAASFVIGTYGGTTLIYNGSRWRPLHP